MATQLRKGACGAAMAEPKLLAEALNAVLRASQLPDDRKSLVVGDDFNNGLDLGALLCSLHSTGFQAAHLGQAITEVNRMIGCSPPPPRLVLRSICVTHLERNVIGYATYDDL